MFYIRCKSLVPYSVEQMFNLVNDINSYSNFIPGFNIIHILKQTNTEIIAEVNFFFVGINKSIVTHNFFIKNKSIVIFLMNSPFKSFYGCWKFNSITDFVCNVEYVSSYEFKSIFFEKMFNNVFQEIYSNIIKIFISRAHSIYGTKVLINYK